MTFLNIRDHPEGQSHSEQGHFIKLGEQGDKSLKMKVTGTKAVLGNRKPRKSII